MWWLGLSQDPVAPSQGSAAVAAEESGGAPRRTRPKTAPVTSEVFTSDVSPRTRSPLRQNGSGGAVNPAKELQDRVRFLEQELSQARKSEQELREQLKGEVGFRPRNRRSDLRNTSGRKELDKRGPAQPSPALSTVHGGASSKASPPARPGARHEAAHESLEEMQRANVAIARENLALRQLIETAQARAECRLPSRQAVAPASYMVDAIGKPQAEPRSNSATPRRARGSQAQSSPVASPRSPSATPPGSSPGASSRSRVQHENASPPRSYWPQDDRESHREIAAQNVPARMNHSPLSKSEDDRGDSRRYADRAGNGIVSPSTPRSQQSSIPVAKAREDDMVSEIRHGIRRLEMMEKRLTLVQHEIEATKDCSKPQSLGETSGTASPTASNNSLVKVGHEWVGGNYIREYYQWHRPGQAPKATAANIVPQRRCG